jgi:hypothetical protein
MWGLYAALCTSSCPQSAVIVGSDPTRLLCAGGHVLLGQHCALVISVWAARARVVSDAGVPAGIHDLDRVVNQVLPELKAAHGSRHRQHLAAPGTIVGKVPTVRHAVRTLLGDIVGNLAPGILCYSSSIGHLVFLQCQKKIKDPQVSSANSRFKRRRQAS